MPRCQLCEDLPPPERDGGGVDLYGVESSGATSPEVPASNRLGGLDVCDLCLSAHLAERMKERWGWDLDCHQYVTESRNNGVETSRAIVTKIELKLPTATSIRLQFRKRNLVRALTGLFAKNHKTGDDIFDSKVAVSGPADVYGARLLEDEGVQSVLMTFAMSGKVDIVGSAIEAEHVSMEVEQSENALAAEICTVAYRLARIHEAPPPV